MEKNATTTPEASNDQDQPTLTDAVLKEIKAQAEDFADQVDLGDSEAEKAARRWLIIGWTAGVTALLRQEATDRYVRLVEAQKASSKW